MNSSIQQFSPDNLPKLTSFLRETGQSHATTTEFPGQSTVSNQPFNQFMSACTNTPSSIHSSTAATESAVRTAQKEPDSLLRASFNVNSGLPAAFNNSTARSEQKDSSSSTESLPEAQSSPNLVEVSTNQQIRSSNSSNCEVEESHPFPSTHPTYGRRSRELDYEHVTTWSLNDDGLAMSLYHKPRNLKVVSKTSTVWEFRKYRCSTHLSTRSTMTTSHCQASASAVARRRSQRKHSKPQEEITSSKTSDISQEIATAGGNMWNKPIHNTTSTWQNVRRQIPDMAVFSAFSANNIYGEGDTLHDLSKGATKFVTPSRNQAISVKEWHELFQKCFNDQSLVNDNAAINL